MVTNYFGYKNSMEPIRRGGGEGGGGGLDFFFGKGGFCV